MKKYKVFVEKKMYAIGTVKVDAANECDAIDDVRDRIASRNIQTTDVEWYNPQYDDHSFDATGDVDEA